MTNSENSQRPTDDLCICGHARDEHEDSPHIGESHDRGCSVTDCSCPEFEAEEDDEWDGDEDREPDGECYRGGEYAASVAHDMAEARKLK